MNKNPQTMSVDGFLQTQSTTGKQILEFVLWYAVEQGDLFGDLVDGLIERWEFACIGQSSGGFEVETDD